MKTAFDTARSPEECTARLRAAVGPDSSTWTSSGKGEVFGVVGDDTFEIRQVSVWLGFDRRFPCFCGLGLRGTIRPQGDGSRIELRSWGDQVFRVWVSASLLSCIVLCLAGLYVLAKALWIDGPGARGDIMALPFAFALAPMAMGGAIAMLGVLRAHPTSYQTLCDWVAETCEAGDLAEGDQADLALRD